MTLKMDQQVTKELRGFEADHVWINENLGVLVKQYSDQWIAVKNQQVVASDPEIEGLLKKVANPSHTCIEFITREPLEMIL